MALLAPLPSAANVTLPPACRKRFVVAVVVSGPTVIATAAPTATPVPAAAASAVLFVDPVWLALALKLPLTTSVPPLPRVASVLLVGSDSATAGDTAVPPAEPAVTLVVIALFDAAFIVKLLAPVTVALSCTCASVLL